MADPFYPIVVVALSVEDGGGFMGYAPDLRGCMSDGETAEEAFKNVSGAIVEWLAEMRESGLAIPEPGSFSKKLAADIEKFRDQAKKLAEVDQALDQLKSDVEKLLTRRDQDDFLWPNAFPFFTSKAQAQGEDIVH